MIDTRTPMMYLDIHVATGGTFVQDVPEQYNGFAYVWRGAGSFTDEKISVEMGKVNFVTSHAIAEGVLCFGVYFYQTYSEE